MILQGMILTSIVRIIPYFYVENGEDPIIYTRLLNNVKTQGRVIDGKFVPLDEIPG